MALAIPIMMAVGTAVSAVGAINSARAESAAANFNAGVAQRNAGIATQQGEADAAQSQKANLMRLGAIKAGFGASGVDSSGSPLDVLSDSAAQGELDKQNIIYNSRLQAMGYTDSANLDTSKAAQAKQQGIYTAAGTILKGASSIYSNYKSPASPASPGTGNMIPDYGAVYGD